MLFLFVVDEGEEVVEDDDEDDDVRARADMIWKNLNLEAVILRMIDYHLYICICFE